MPYKVYIFLYLRSTFSDSGVREFMPIIFIHAISIFLVQYFVQFLAIFAASFVKFCSIYLFIFCF